ncbi:MAG: hypothetical protein LBT98_03715 [Puniceicoccales bacterium]|jgi:hypothetical protein|nr:hypothetical protein [Puniceicoccales bacterium]
MRFKLPAQIVAKVPAIFLANVIDMDKQSDQRDLIFIHGAQKSQGAFSDKSFCLKIFRLALQLEFRDRDPKKGLTGGAAIFFSFPWSG